MLRRAWFYSLLGLLAVAATLPAASAAEAPAAPTAATSPMTLDRLLGELGKMPGLEARFVERKHMKLLVKPLVTKGTLYFTPPGYLARHVTAPKPAKMLITPRHLEITQGKGNKQLIDLSARKDVKTFVESFARLLAGDKKGLEAVYGLTFKPDPKAADAWTLQLTPKSATLRKLIAKLTVSGKGFAVQSIRVDETSGDWSVTEITGANPKRTFSKDERKQLFGL